MSVRSSLALAPPLAKPFPALVRQMTRSQPGSVDEVPGRWSGLIESEAGCQQPMDELVTIDQPLDEVLDEIPVREDSQKTDWRAWWR